MRSLPPYRDFKQSGMSLMEVMVALALLVAMVGLAVPYLGSLMGVHVRENARKLGSTVQYLFDQAAMTGKTYRVAFNVDRHAWWVEVNTSDKDALVYKSPSDREEGEQSQAELMEELERARESGISAASKMSMPLADVVLSSFERIQDDEIKPVVLPDTVYLAGVWTPQYEDVQRPEAEPPDDETKDRIAYVHLFPGGYAERAFIYLSDGDQDFYTLEVEPLTGRVRVHNEEIEVPREYRLR